MEVKGPYMHTNRRLILIQKWCYTRDFQLTAGASDPRWRYCRWYFTIAVHPLICCILKANLEDARFSCWRYLWGKSLPGHSYMNCHSSQFLGCRSFLLESTNTPLDIKTAIGGDRGVIMPAGSFLFAIKKPISKKGTWISSRSVTDQSVTNWLFLGIGSTGG